MRILVLADMEGIHGIEWAKDVEESNELMTAEVLLVVEVLRSIGVWDITVCDAHDRGKNMHREKFTEKDVEVVSQVRSVDFTREYDAALLVGTHGMAGSGSVFAHTLREDIARVEADGEVIGEVGIFIRWFRENSISTIFVSGDEQAVAEALTEDASCITLVAKRSEYRSMDAYYQRKYEKKLKRAIEGGNFNLLKRVSEHEKDLRLYLRNQDSIPFIKVQNRVKENYLWFESYSELLELMVDICEDLNLAKQKILQENSNFIEEMRRKYRHVNVQEIEDTRLHQLLSKDVYTLEYRERLYITEVLQSLVEKKTIETLDR